MPRGPRIDVEGALYHVIARGVERRPIFRCERDREDFVQRVARLAGAADITVFAYVLLDNHFHLVVRRGQQPLGQFMRRLLTGYSTAFNRRHRRAGHLFQNRYQAVLCDAAGGDWPGGAGAADSPNGRQSVPGHFDSRRGATPANLRAGQFSTLVRKYANVSCS